MKDNIFTNMDRGNTVFKDKSPLSHKFLPEQLPHRNDQITMIAKFWIDALDNVTPNDITIYGKTGTGKTAAAKFAQKQLLEAAQNNNTYINVEYIRCTDYTTEYQVLAQLCQRLGRDVPYRGWTKGEIINTFDDILDQEINGHKLILIIIVDEIDILLEKDGDGLLYTLTRTENVSVLSISNYLDFKKFIGPRVMSSLRDKEIVFPPYRADQLADILNERSAMSFKENVLKEDVIPLCSAMAAKEEGDARYALDLLSTAGDIADDNESNVVLGDYVITAKNRIEHNKVTDIINTLPTQQQRVLEAILILTQDNEEISSGKLYDTYKQ